MSTRKKPLEGVKVIELATFIAAATTGRFLADLGADVIKIESAKGDPLRYTAPTEGRPLDMYENISVTYNSWKYNIIVNHYCCKIENNILIKTKFFSIS